jgi:hypothetical protein
MYRLCSRIRIMAFAACSAVYADSYWSHQCPGFATTEQPYLYLCTADAYKGDPLYITNTSVPDLGRIQIGKEYSDFFNDKASSLRIRGKWRVCTERSYGGQCTDISSADWKSELGIDSTKAKLEVGFADSISSVKLLSCSRF